MRDASSWEDSLHTPCEEMDLDLDIARDRTAPARARRAVAGLAGRLDPDVLSDTTLLVSELVSNSVKYGRGDTVALHVGVHGARRLVVEVTDEGSGFAPRIQRGPRFEAGGFGLRLVDELSSAWGVHDGAAHVWFEIDRSSDLAAAA